MHVLGAFACVSRPCPDVQERLCVVMHPVLQTAGGQKRGCDTEPIGDKTRRQIIKNAENRCAKQDKKQDNTFLQLSRCVARSSHLQTSYIR